MCIENVHLDYFCRLTFLRITLIFFMTFNDKWMISNAFKILTLIVIDKQCTVMLSQINALPRRNPYIISVAETYLGGSSITNVTNFIVSCFYVKSRFVLKQITIAGNCGGTYRYSKYVSEVNCLEIILLNYTSHAHLFPFKSGTILAFSR